MEEAPAFLERGQLVEIEGLAEEGFPASFVQGIVLQTEKAGVIVEYLEFLDEVSGKQLIEYQPFSRFRPFLPAAARFQNWEDIQAGMSVELYEDDVWWKGMVLRKSPAGVFVYLPEVNQSTHFEKLLRNLRPGYDWISEAAAAAGGGDSNGQQQQQQQARTGHWERRVIDEELLRKCNMDPKQVKAAAAGVPHPLAAQLPHEPRFSEFVRGRDPSEDNLEAVDAALAAAYEVEAAEAAAAAAAAAEADAKLAADAAAAAAAAAAATEAALAAAAKEAAAEAAAVAAAKEAAAQQQALQQQQAGASAAAAGMKSEPGTSGPDASAVKMEIDSAGPEQDASAAVAALDAAVAAAAAAAAAAVKAEPGAAAAAAAALSSDTGKLQDAVDQNRLHVELPQALQQPTDVPMTDANGGFADPSQLAAAAAALAAAAPAAAGGDGHRPGRQASAGVAAAAAAAGASLAAPRRTTRGVKSRIVYVDGVPVLKDNLYDLNEGEPSVFNKELSDKPYTEAHAYSAVPPASPASFRRQQQLQHMRQQRQQHNMEREERCLAGDAAAAAAAAGGGAKPKGTKAQNAQQQARLKHNQGVKASANATVGLRATYLASHLEQLRPFIAPNVAESISAAAAAAPHMEPPEPPTTQPEQIKAVLRDYQLEGLSWMVSQHQRGLNSILADEMGLGKTLQSITFLAHLKWVMDVPGPHLVVVPLSVTSSWMTELARWCPDLRAVKLHTADPEERKRLKREVLARPDSFDVAVTTYEMVNSAEFGRPIQSTITWRYLVLDEGHRVRNMDTLTAKALRSVQRGNVLLLTGTPLQNNMVELYGMLAFMYPDVFTTPGPFEAAFNLVKGTVDQEALSAAHYLLRPFCLRRLKNEVEVTLPPKVETRIATPLSSQQIFWYRRLLLRNHEALAALEAAVTKGPQQNTPKRRGRWAKKDTSASTTPAAAADSDGGTAAAAEAGACGEAAANGNGTTTADASPADSAAAAAAAGGNGSGNAEGAAAAPVAPADQPVVAQGNTWRRLLNLIMQLRKVVNHPFMMPDSEPRGDGTSTLQELLDASGKLSVLHRLLTKLKARGHRVVLFSQFTMMLGILEDYLSQAGFEYVRLDGSVSRVQRMISISQFNKPGSKISIFLASTRSGGLGLNLQTADTVILYDSDWNPQWDLQAMARVHRIGQTKPVHVYRLVTGSSVEERMLQRADAKLYLDQMVNRGSTARAQQLDGMSTGELLSMLSFGADRILANDAGEAPSDADLDTILDRSKDAANAALEAEQRQAQLHREQREGSMGGGGDGSRRGSASDGEQQQREGSAGAGSSKAPAAAPAAPAAAAAAAAAGADDATAGHTILKPLQTTAATFQADAPPPSTFTLNGVDYSAAGLEKLRREAEQEAAALMGKPPPGPATGKRKRGRPARSQVQPEPSGDGADGDAGEDEDGAGEGGSGGSGRKSLHPAVRKLCGGRGSGADEEGVKAMLRSIGREYWEAHGGKDDSAAPGEKPHRSNKERTVIVDGYQVLKVNNYQMVQGGISAWEEAGGKPGEPAPRKRKVQKAGRDYAHAEACQVCWDGGELVCCDVCPAAYHADCLGQDPAHLEAKQHWACPHHACSSCGRGPAAAGGLLFRCGVCESAWCEDHLPAGHDILGDWPLFEALGQVHPTNACFILCGPDCQALKARLDPVINTTIQHYTDHPELRFKEREEDAPEQQQQQQQYEEAPPPKKKKKGKKQRVQTKGRR